MRHTQVVSGIMLDNKTYVWYAMITCYFNYLLIINIMCPKIEQDDVLWKYIFRFIHWKRKIIFYDIDIHAFLCVS